MAHPIAVDPRERVRRSELAVLRAERYPRLARPVHAGAQRAALASVGVGASEQGREGQGDNSHALSLLHIISPQALVAS